MGAGAGATRTAAAAFLLLVAVSSTAHAQYDVVGILSLEADGVSPTAAEKLEAGIEEGIAGTSSDEHPRVATRQRLTEMLAHSKFDPGCRFGPCLEEIYKNTKVRMVLVGRIASSGPSYNFLVSLMDTRSGLLMSQVTTRCAVCTLDEAIASATLATIELITRAENGDEDPEAGAATAVTPAVAELAALQKQTASRRRSIRRTGLFFLSAALLAAGAGAYFAATDDLDVGYPLLAAGGAFAVTSTTLFVLSRRF
jgi:hypothetical protein